VLVKDKDSRAEIHQALLSQFSLLAQFTTVKDKDSKVLMLVNLTPAFENW
jgi:hypothetical protein